ncbi:MAG: F0F1 ATP synthase subunit delta [Bacteroidales bacterium]|jgi:F-type H+-transporting ATPase subunit delta|nr:F0F1 ATP synthase subunit delta [Bacteroidales bacterium]NLH23319.1 hypothetical protein [Bacteroidales bacterium]HPJ82861.1 F0F1 ATP synthase subunit delta [Bacteroidales bacterium]
MNTGVIASRYAAALLQYATSCGADRDLYDMMKRISACFSEIPDLERSFCNRIISNEDRKALFLDLFPGAPEKSLKVLSVFLDLLLRQRREYIVRSVSLGYVDKYRLQQGITYSVLTTVVPVDDSTAERIKSFLDPVNPQKVELELKQDAGLIGGFSLRVGMKVWDASLLARLREVRKAYGLKDIY